MPRETDEGSAFEQLLMSHGLTGGLALIGLGVGVLAFGLAGGILYYWSFGLVGLGVITILSGPMRRP